MRSLVVLALLWQTAVVLGLGVPDNNNRASSTLPWVGTEVWSTTIKKSYADQIFTTTSELYAYVSDNTACDERLLTLDVNDGSQMSSAPFHACGFTSAVQQLPFVATLNNDKGVNVFAVNSTGVSPIMSFPPSSQEGAIFSVGDRFYWFITDDESTNVTIINPRTRTSTTNKGPRTSLVAADDKHLFTMGWNTKSMYCYSATSGDVIWFVHIPGSAVVRLVPSPSSDTVLFIFSNYSFSLFNSNTGEWIWTTSKNVPNGPSSLTAVFAANTVILNMKFGLGLFDTTAVNVTSGKILWEVVGGPNIAPSYSCALKSNLILTLFISDKPFVHPKYSLIGLDVLTGEKVLDFTNALGTDYDVKQVHCQNDDVYFVAMNYPGHQKLEPHVVVQRITFAPHP